jgi:uncharacterized protein (UPF0332 family)
MTPEAEAYLATAREDLREAGLIAALPLAKAAARAAYYAAFHAAEGFIFERTGKVVKTHSGVRSEFSRLLIGAVGIDATLVQTLNKGYAYKDLADYGTGKGRVITNGDAAEMIAAATRFVARVTELLTAPPATGRP